MPELPEVETVRRGLAPLLAGKTVLAFAAGDRPLRHPLPDLQRLCGQKLTSVLRRSKYLLFSFETGELLVWHLGMTGQFHVLAPDAPAGAHEHVRIDFEQGLSLRYRDSRRFGYAGLLQAEALDEHPWFRHLGPEPLEDGFDGACLHAACKGRRAPIKAVLMDARIVVGVGNIYASESLFRAGIHPLRPAGNISPARMQRLAAAVKQVLGEAIDAGGSSIRDFVRADGRPGYFAHSFAVYGREHAPCPQCGAAVRRKVIAGRSSFYCPHCQR